MSYQNYNLQIHGKKSYYSLLGLISTATIFEIKKKIHLLRKFIKPATNSCNSFYLKQWTDLMKITNTFINDKSKKKYDKFHHLAIYSQNAELYVK